MGPEHHPAQHRLYRYAGDSELDQRTQRRAVDRRSDDRELHGQRRAGNRRIGASSGDKRIRPERDVRI